MADSITISMDGIDHVLGNIANLTPALTIAAMKVIIDGAKQCYQDSQDTVPVDTGALKDSGFMLFEEGLITVGYGVDLPEPYQWYVEEGTSKQAAQPFLYPAFLNAVAKIEADLHGMLP